MAAAGMFTSLAAQPALSNRRAAPMVNSSSSSGDSGDSGSSSSSGAATISANDFLTLLVTEMKNQDPTTQTDPNEYINQLVEVNSLEQLISINQTLTGALGSSGASSSGSSGHSVAAEAGSSAVSGAHIPAAALPQAASSTAPGTPGNLSVPEAAPAALRVAHALDGQAHSRVSTSLTGLR